MEGVPTKEVVSSTAENVESLDAWRALKEQAPTEAEALVNSIDGFSELDADAQVSALNELLAELATDNKNRFVAEEIAKRLAVIEEEARHASRLSALGMAA